MITFLSSDLPVLVEKHLHDLLAEQRDEIERQKALRRTAEAAQAPPQVVAREATPEERLGLLLESLKPLCESPEEFSACCAEAESILLRDGFRSARDFVVRVHGEFREREKLAASLETGPAS